MVAYDARRGAVWAGRLSTMLDGMSVFVPSTTVRVEAQAATDPNEAPARTVKRSGVNATIYAPSGRDSVLGQQSTVDARMVYPEFDLDHTDVVVDETDGAEYHVTWLLPRRGPTGGHTEAGLKRVQGRD